MNTVLSFILKLLSTDVAKTLIGLAVNKLITSTNDGVTKDIAITMIDGIAKSQANPTTKDIFKDALTILKG